MPGTSEWILEEQLFRKWVDDHSSNVLWLYAKPAKGKSILSSYLIHHLQVAECSVQYYFFRYGDQPTRSMGSMLRSLAFQLAEECPAYRKALSKMDEDGIQLKDSDWRLIWHQLFVSNLFTLNDLPSCYWIVDGLDEAELPPAFLDLLQNIVSSAIPIHVLLVSRWLAPIQSGIDKLTTYVQTESMCIDDASSDISIYVEKELQYVSWASEISTRVAQKVVQKANGNFLWVHLALEEIKDCHTEEDVNFALEELPPGMEPLYQRMEDSIQRHKRPTDKALARQLLMWALYSQTPISIPEIHHILEPSFGSLLNIKATLSQLCGHFVVVESGSHIALVHQTAREFLSSSTRLPFSLEPITAHNEMFSKSLSVYLDPGARSRIRQASELKFLKYRATYWAHHLNSASNTGNTDLQLDVLVRFFNEPGTLSWIHSLAVFNRLKTLIEVSKQLNAFVRKQRLIDANRTPLLHRLSDLSLLESWSRDLLKLVAKFGSHLVHDPAAIYKCVVPFCPTESAIYKSFSRLSSQSLKVHGASQDWDDCLARVSIGSEQRALEVMSSSRYLAILSASGAITIWDRETLEELKVLDHREAVYSLCFNDNGDRLASSGPKTLKIWNVSSGSLLRCISIPYGTNGMFLKFGNDDRVITMASDRHEVLTVMLDFDDNTWQQSDPALLEETDIPEGTYRSSPTVIVISPDGVKIAAAYRRFPISVWQIDPPRAIKRISRRHDSKGHSKPLPFGDKLAWHPNSEDLLGIFQDASIFKQNIVDDSYQELPADQGATLALIKCSPDGKIFATADTGGSIRLYNFELFAIIYKLSSEDRIMALCFDYSSRRFYDIRRNYCNVWEPAALTRMSEEDELMGEGNSDSVSVSQSIHASESSADTHRPLTASGMLSGTPLLCTADVTGTIEIHDVDLGRIRNMTDLPTGLPVPITCSMDGRFFAFVEYGTSVKIFSVEQVLGSSSDMMWSQQLVRQFKVISPSGSGDVIAILLRPDSKCLLAVYTHGTQLWAIENTNLITTLLCETQQAGHDWISSPLRSGQLLSLTPTSITFYSWDSLEASAPVSFASDDTKSTKTSAPDVKETVEKAWNTYFDQHILLQISRTATRVKLRPRFAIVKCFSINNPGTPSHDSPSAQEVPIPTDIAALIEWPINIFKDGRLVFIDRHFWVCTWKFASLAKRHDVVRHFFLPRDWISTESLQLSHITPEGKILWLRKGEVAVIESDLGSEW